MHVYGQTLRLRRFELLLLGLLVTLALSSCQPVRPESELAAADESRAEVVESPVLSGESNREEAQTYIDGGIDLYEAGDLQQSIACFDQAVAVDPNLAEAYLARGMVRFESMLRNNTYDQIISVKEDFDKAIDLEPGLTEAYCQRGRIHFMLAGQFFVLYPVIMEQGAADYGMVLELAPDGPCREEAEQFLELSREYDAEAMRQMIETEIADATGAIERNPQDLGAYWTRATQYASIGEGDQAVADLKTLIEIGVESNRLSPEQLEVLEEIGALVENDFDPLPFILMSPGLPD
jgi:tetratricopeptide (TPR) repeat protein